MIRPLTTALFYATLVAAPVEARQAPPAAAPAAIADTIRRGRIEFPESFILGFVSIIGGVGGVVVFQRLTGGSFDGTGVVISYAVGQGLFAALLAR